MRAAGECDHGRAEHADYSSHGVYFPWRPEVLRSYRTVRHQRAGGYQFVARAVLTRWSARRLGDGCNRGAQSLGRRSLGEIDLTARRRSLLQLSWFRSVERTAQLPRHIDRCAMDVGVPRR